MTPADVIRNVQARERSAALVAIRAQRDMLAERCDQAKSEYQHLENLIAELRRNIDAMYGGLQELDNVIDAMEEGN